ncbi:MAG: hypothetical protein AABY32_04385 [Nanoarchaeota archaeon]
MDNYIKSRLEELKKMKTGWLEGRGVVPKKEDIDWLYQQLEKYYSSDIPTPLIYPTYAGGVEFDWTFINKSVTLEINIKNHTADYHNLEFDTNFLKCRNLNLNLKEDWDWFNNQIFEINIEPRTIKNLD